MSLAQIEQFYAIATHDGPLQDKLAEGGASVDQIIANAVREGQALGYVFTLDEATAWMKNRQATSANGELSDHQLEAVAGGKNTPFKPTGRNVFKPPAQAATLEALIRAFHPPG